MASILLVGFWLVASVFILLSAIIFTFFPKVSQAFEDLLLYGKVRTEHRKWSVVQLIEVPKRFVAADQLTADFELEMTEETHRRCFGYLW